MKLQEFDSLGQSFEFLQIPAFLTVEELDRVLFKRKKKVEESKCAKVLFVDFEEPHTSENLRLLKEFCLKIAQTGSACCMVDNVLLAKKTDAQGILFSKFPSAPHRLREVLGPSSHIGLKLKNQEARQRIEEFPGADQIDFFFYEDLHKLATSRVSSKITQVQSSPKSKESQIHNFKITQNRVPFYG